ncbi:hypothetical protein BDR05DRAFT_679377 [Suillus weaverae]|nr:hypothetical protein BDR05DRAFT_679377 [Suillus weaverae]
MGLGKVLVVANILSDIVYSYRGGCERRNNIDIELVHHCIKVGLTVMYTSLVAHRLLGMRSKMKEVVA